MSDGFALQRRTVTLKFEEIEDLDGLEVKCRLDVPLSVYLDLTDSMSGADDPNKASDFREGFTIFSEQVLIDWNLTEDGKKVTPDKDGFFKLSAPRASKILVEYLGAISNPPENL